MAIPVRSSLLTLLFITGCSDNTPTTEAPPPGVTYVTAETIEFKPYQRFVGRTEAPQDVAIRARVEGELLEIGFSGGETLEQGHLLFRLDDAPLREEVARQEANVISAESHVKVASANFERGKQIVGAGAISRAELDELEGRALEAEAALASARAALETARINLGYAHITAPISGRTSESLVDVGDLISPSTGTLTTMVQIDPIYVVFYVNEQLATQARIQAARQQTTPEQMLDIRLEVVGEAFPEPGEIINIDNRIDPSTGTIRVRASIPNPDEILYPGQTVDVIVETQEGENALVIPQAAVLEDQAGRYVLTVADDDTVDRVYLELGPSTGANLVVENGLAEGTRVIVEGLQKVRQGTKVSAVPRKAAPFQ